MTVRTKFLCFGGFSGSEMKKQADLVEADDEELIGGSLHVLFHLQKKDEVGC